jgi:hypothetical protein
MSKLTNVTVAAGLVAIMLGGGPALAQQPTFADPEAAAEAFREALLEPAGWPAARALRRGVPG